MSVKTEIKAFDFRPFLLRGDIQMIAHSTGYDRNWVREILKIGHGNKVIIQKAIDLISGRHNQYEVFLKEYRSAVEAATEM